MTAREEISRAYDEEDYPKLHTLCLENQDCPQALFLLGDMYAWGKGVEKNPALAVEWYRKGAARGHRIAQYCMGLHLEEGVGIEKDIDAAFEYFVQSAGQDFPPALNKVGVYYLTGKRVCSSADEPLYFFKKASDLGSPYASLNAGKFIYFGWGEDDPNRTEATKWFAKAANQGNAEALAFLANAYYHAYGVEQNYEKAYQYFLQAAQKGNTMGMLRLAGLYESGKGVKKDYSMALQWFKTAYKNGAKEALFHIGKYYENGFGTNVDYQTARIWYLKAIEEANDDKAMVNLGCMYYRRQLGPRDVDTADKWFAKAEALGNLTAKKNRWILAGNDAIDMYNQSMIEDKLNNYLSSFLNPD